MNNIKLTEIKDKLAKIKRDSSKQHYKTSISQLCDVIIKLTDELMLSLLPDDTTEILTSNTGNDLKVSGNIGWPKKDDDASNVPN
jgi:hypothetical protein